MTKKEKINKVISFFDKRYKNASCSLEYSEPYRLLLATRLSAQCTDLRVNIVTKELFRVYPTIDSLANANIDDVINIVKPCGLGNTKGRDLVLICQKLIDNFDSCVPDNMNDLLSLPGVGRKTANLILGDIFHKPAVVADTHLIRISNRLGLVNKNDPKIVEFELKKLLPPKKSANFCHKAVFFGRNICNARKPKCDICELFELCNYVKTFKIENKNLNSRVQI